MFLRKTFGCLTDKNIQHLLLRYDLGQDCCRPALVGPGAQRGLLHLHGRSRLAVPGNRSGSQILAWHEDLELGSRKMLARLRLQFPDLRRGTGRTTQKSEAAWGGGGGVPDKPSYER